MSDVFVFIIKSKLNSSRSFACVDCLFLANLVSPFVSFGTAVYDKIIFPYTKVFVAIIPEQHHEYYITQHAESGRRTFCS